MSNPTVQFYCVQSAPLSILQSVQALPLLFKSVHLFWADTNPTVHMFCSVVQTICYYCPIFDLFRICPYYPDSAPAVHLFRTKLHPNYCRNFTLFRLLHCCSDSIFQSRFRPGCPGFLPFCPLNTAVQTQSLLSRLYFPPLLYRLLSCCSDAALLPRLCPCWPLSSSNCHHCPEFALPV